MATTKRDNFSASVVRKVAERASYICSNPRCNRVTVGPDESSATASIKTGEAAHICAAAPGGPRYDMSQTAAERTGIKNALWLCAACADLIDKNGGSGFPATNLRKWKRDHESLIKECLDGGRRLVIQFLPHHPDEKIARRIIHLLEDKAALFAPYDQEDAVRVLDSLKELRVSLTSIRSEIDPESLLSVIVESIVSACRHYMNNTPKLPDPEELNISLGAVRKIVGMNIGDLLNHYKVIVSNDLQSIIPQ